MPNCITYCSMKVIADMLRKSRSKTRVSQLIVVAMGLQLNVPAAAQSSDNAVDIFGVYTPPLFRTMPPVTQPDVYPFTPQAQAFFGMFYDELGRGVLAGAGKKVTLRADGTRKSEMIGDRLAAATCPSGRTELRT